MLDRMNLELGTRLAVLLEYPHRSEKDYSSRLNVGSSRRTSSQGAREVEFNVPPLSSVVTGISLKFERVSIDATLHEAIHKQR